MKSCAAERGGSGEGLGQEPGLHRVGPEHFGDLLQLGWVGANSSPKGFRRSCDGDQMGRSMLMHLDGREDGLGDAQRGKIWLCVPTCVLLGAVWVSGACVCAFGWDLVVGTQQYMVGLALSRGAGPGLKKPRGKEKSQRKVH